MKDIIRSRLDGDIDVLAKQFLTSISDDLEIIKEDILGTIAHDMMLMEENIINKEEAAKIIKGLMVVLNDFESGSLEIDDSYEDIHPFIEAKVTMLIGPGAGGKIHSGRSRNDQVALDIRLKLRSLLSEIRHALLNIIMTLIKKSSEFKDTPFPLYTHLQQAQLGTFGHLLLAWAHELTRHAFRLEECHERTNRSPLGACAIGGTLYPINRESVAKKLGFDGIIENSIDAVSSRDVLIEHSSIIASIMVSLSRISEDLIIYSSNEFKFVELPDELCSVSSVLPQKKNPDILEMVRSTAAKAIGALTTQLTIAKATPTGYNRDFQDCKPVLWKSHRLLILVLKVMNKLLSGIRLDVGSIMDSTSNSYIFALDFAELLSLQHEIPFRTAHEFVATAIKKLMALGIQGNQLGSPEAVALLKTTALEILGKDDCISPEIINILQENRSFMKRKSKGAPTQRSIEKMIENLGKSVESLKSVLEKQDSSIERSIKNLLADASQIADFAEE